MADALLPKLEESILEFWKREGIFAASLKRPSPNGNFVFYEGPPYANGKPGVHHMVSRAYKDAVARYKTMQGFHVARKAGWDTHGLPVEMAVEKLLGVKSKREIEETIGVEKFVEECRKNVFAMKGEWEKFTERMGYWVDLQDAYVTMTPEYIESCWWIFNEIHKRGLLEPGFKVVPFCTRCGTALSSHELAQGYKNVTDNSVYVKFELVDEPGTFVLAWTTTPWTLPGNVALAVGEKVDYVKVSRPVGWDENGKVRYEKYVLARVIYEKAFADNKHPYWPVTNEEYAHNQAEGHEAVKGFQIEKIKAKDLVGLKYKPLFDFLDLGKETGQDAYKIVPADFVTTEDGTGVVHTAVMYGEDDFNLGKQHDLPMVHTVDTRGNFNQLVKPWAGEYVKSKATEEKIVTYLKVNGKLYDEKPYEHDYPFCWRCDTPLLYYAKDSWFFKTTKVKEELLAANESINWMPEYIKKGRMGEWLSNVQDWAISRERYWGIPLPIWRCDKKHYQVISSLDELKKNATQPLPENFDPHRPFIDAVKIKCSQCDGEMTRVPEVADVWYDSGCVPLAQRHYPFENKELIDSGQQYPADFISEGIDQTRGWFYTMLAVATLLGRAAPYKNVISLGLVNDAQGKKMSKSKGNYVQPLELFPKFGADPVRFYLYSVSQAGDFKNFDEKGVDQVVKKTFLITLNVLSFLKLYQKEHVALPSEVHHVMDRWLLARLNQLTNQVTEKCDAYDITSSTRLIADFVTELSTWYVRRSRDRFKAGGDDAQTAAAVLGHAVLTTAKLLAPFTPMFADHLYQEYWKGQTKPQISVHLEDWPKPAKANESILSTMGVAQAAVEVVHALRKEAGIKLRQPLPQVVLAGTNLPKDLLKLLTEELNVKEVHQSKLPTGHEWVTKTGLGGGLEAVALDTTITDELKIEGLQRDLVRALNAWRKDQKLTISDTVALTIETDDEFTRGVIEHRLEELKREVRASALTLGAAPDGTSIELDDITIRVARA